MIKKKSIGSRVSQEAPFKTEEKRDGVVLLLVIVSIVLVGTLTFTLVLLITCRRCFGRRDCCARCDAIFVFELLTHAVP